VTGCGVLLLVMASGNFANTLETLFSKMRIKSRMKGKNLMQKRVEKENKEKNRYGKALGDS
jgi:hypothetical protein